jgi:hypothetical protein
LLIRLDRSREFTIQLWCCIHNSGHLISRRALTALQKQDFFLWAMLLAWSFYWTTDKAHVHRTYISVRDGVISIDIN